MNERATLFIDVYYVDPEEDVTKRLPAGSVGAVEVCHCAGSNVDYHFYPDSLGGKTMVGVMASEIDFVEVQS